MKTTILKHSFKACFLNFMLVLLLSIIVLSLHAQNLEWAKALGGIDGVNGRDIKIDASGNVITVGMFRGTVDFDPGPGTFNLSPTGEMDIYVSKLSAAGNFIWAKHFSTGLLSNYYQIVRCAVDAYDNIYITGYFFDTQDFDPGPGTYTLTSTGTANAFVLKLDANGEFVWARAINGTSAVIAYSIALDNSGNVLTLGIFADTIDLDPGTENHFEISAGSSDVFISKLSPAGDFIWGKSIESTGSGGAHSITSDALGYVYLSGSFTGTIDVDPGAGTYEFTNTGGNNLFLLKLDSSGDFVWARQTGGYAIAVDHLFNVYATGWFVDTIDFDPGPGVYNLVSQGDADIFIYKLNPTGEFIWARSIGGSNGDFGSSIVIDDFGSVYTAGYFRGTVDFDFGSGNHYLTSSHNDIYINKTSTEGDFIWAVSMGGHGGDLAGSIALDPEYNIYTTGYFGHSGWSADMDPGPGTFNLQSQGAFDAFVHKMSQCVYNEVTLSIAFDNWPEQVSWEVRNAANEVVYSAGPYASNLAGVTITIPMCLKDECHTLTLFDSNNDGICCKGRHKGSYSLTVDDSGEILASGGSYGSSESTVFCFQPAGPECHAPNDVAVFVDATLLGDEVSWSAGIDAISYNVRIRPAGGSWTTYSTNNTFYTLYYGEDLEFCTSYEVEVESVCEGGSSGFSSAVEFLSFGCPPPCDVPTGISAAGVLENLATVSWDFYNGASSYNIRIRPIGGNWILNNTGNTFFDYTNLTACTTYEVEVESVCSVVSSGYAESISFTTAGCEMCGTPTGLYVSHVNNKNARLNWSEVPNAGSYQIRYWAQNSPDNVTTTTSNSTSRNLNGLTVGTTYEWHVRANCSGDWSPYSVVHSFVAGSSSNFNAPGGGGTFAMFRVSPNPTTGKFTINFNGESNNANSIRVFDMLGKMIHTIPLDPLEGHFKTELDISTYPNGIYFIHVLSEDSVLHAEKILKMN